jgi:hypothetical protein
MMDLQNYSFPDKADRKSIITLYRSWGFFVPQEHFRTILDRFPETRVGGMHLRFRWASGYTIKMIQQEIDDYINAMVILEKGGSAPGPISIVTGRKQMFETILADLRLLADTAKELEFGDLIVKKKPARTIGDLLRTEMAKQEA